MWIITLPIYLLVLKACAATTDTNDSETKAIYSREGDGVTFYVMSAMEKPPVIEQAVWSIQLDLTHDDFLFITDGSALKRFNFNDQPLEQTTIIGQSSVHSYREGVHTDALFNIISGFVQVNRTHILLVDSNNHCLRYVDIARRSSSPYAGVCKSLGYIDGDISIAKFNHPRQILKIYEKLYVSDSNNNAIRSVSIGSDRVATWNILSQPPIAFTVDHGLRWLYVATQSGLIKINYGTKEREVIIQSPLPGFQDGTINLAEIDTPYSILEIAKNSYLLAEPHSNRLRVVNLVTQSVTSICTGNEEFLHETRGVDSCQLPQPTSMVYAQGFVLIGTNSTEMRILEYTHNAPPSDRKRTDATTTQVKQKPTTASNDNETSSTSIAAIVTSGAVIIVIVVTLLIVFLTKCAAKREQRNVPAANRDLAVEYLTRHELIGEQLRRIELDRTVSNTYSGHANPPNTSNTTEERVDDSVQTMSNTQPKETLKPPIPKVPAQQTFNVEDDMVTSAAGVISEEMQVSEASAVVEAGRPVLKRKDTGYIEFDENSSHEAMNSSK